MSAFQRDSYTRQDRSWEASGHIPRSHSDACSFMFLNYAALLQKGAPGAPRVKSKPGCTTNLMKFLETLAARPLSLLLVAVIVLSVGVTALCVGFAIHIAGPVSIHIPHVEIPGVEIHTGSAPAITEPSIKKWGAAAAESLRRTRRRAKSEAPVPSRPTPFRASGQAGANRALAF
jgi:hypothetical protein